MKMNLFACTWDGAAFLSFQFPILLSDKLLFIILGLTLTAIYFTNRTLTKLTYYLLVFVASFVWSTWSTKQQLNHWIPQSLENVPLSIEIVISDIVQQPNKNSLLIAKAMTRQWHGTVSIYVNE